ncbi:MAG TPA: glycerol kinase GlpK [Verrucomicrobiota bacterium]|nr:glycerol kinase GlpK [Verrucomicrobiota bacterium]
MSLILAIDQSTSGTKAVLFDGEGTVLDKAVLHHRQIYPRPGWLEHDAEEIWKNVLAAIGEIARRNRSKLNKLAALSITNQRETVVAFDRKTGRPLYNALVWQDRRGDALCSELARQGHENRVRRKTGLKIDAYFSASKIRWLVENKPSIAARLKSGDAVIGTIDTYLIHRLTGGKVFATDFTNASRTLLFDIGRLKWDANLCALFKVPMCALPEVRESSDWFGETDAKGNLPKRVPIVGVMGDSQASLFAQRCYKPGSVKATFGTGTSVMLNIGDKLRIPHKGTVTALAWVLHGKPTYAFEGIINFSAATIEWLRNQLGMIQSAGEVEVMAGQVTDNGGVYLVPAFAGLGAPHWAPAARAAFLGMTAFTQREHFVRAAQESIAYQIRDVLDMMQAEADVPLRTLHADGKPSRNGFLMQFTADVTRTELKVAHVAESSAWGAAMNGLLGLKICRSLKELATLPHGQQTFKPRMKPAIAKQYHDGWLAAVKRVL